MTAQGIEAHSDKTRSGLAEGESPVGAADAPNLSSEAAGTAQQAPAGVSMPTDRTDPVEVREVGLDRALRIGEQVASLSPWKEGTDNHARILQAATAGARLAFEKAALASTPEAQPEQGASDAALLARIRYAIRGGVVAGCNLQAVDVAELANRFERLSSTTAPAMDREAIARALYEHWVEEDFGNEYCSWPQLADKATWLARADAILALTQLPAPPASQQSQEGGNG